MGVINSSTPATGNETGSKRLLKGYWCFNFPPQGDPLEVERCKITNREFGYKIKHALPTGAGFRIVCK